MESYYISVTENSVIYWHSYHNHLDIMKFCDMNHLPLL